MGGAVVMGRAVITGRTVVMGGMAVGMADVESAVVQVVTGMCCFNGDNGIVFERPIYSKHPPCSGHQI